MGKTINQVMLMGRLTSDVEVRKTTTGKSVASFTLAVSKSTGDEADFFDVSAWEKSAELLEQYTKKGSKIIVQGRLGQQSWEDKESGKKRSKVVITATDVTFLDTKSEAKKDTVNNDVGDEPINLDDIPF